MSNHLADISQLSLILNAYIWQVPSCQSFHTSLATSYVIEIPYHRLQIDLQSFLYFHIPYQSAAALEIYNFIELQIMMIKCQCSKMKNYNKKQIYRK